MWECSLSCGSAPLYSSPLLLCKAWVHKQHPVPLSGLFVGGVCRNAALLCFIYDKICRFNFAVVRVWICDSFFLVCSAKSSGSLTPSTLADVFRCYVLCGLSELNILFWAFRDSVEPTDFFLPSFNQVFFSVVGWGGEAVRVCWQSSGANQPFLFHSQCHLIDIRFFNWSGWYTVSVALLRIDCRLGCVHNSFFTWPLSWRSSGDAWSTAVWSAALRGCLSRSPPRINRQYQAIIA